MRRTLVLTAFLIGCLLFTSSMCFAADKYIRTGATGSKNGSDWTNAYPTFASVVWTRGDTYYVAGGTYSENVTIAKAESATTQIIIKKANATNNSRDAGWNSSFANTQAVINGNLTISNGYITIDGITGSGQTGHGIKVHSSTSSAGNALVNLASGVTAFITLSHIELQGVSFNDANGWSALKQPNGMTPTKGAHISYCYIHDFSQNGVVFTGVQGTSSSDYGLLFENNYLYNIGGTSGGGHGQSIQCGSGAATGESYETQSYWIIRNNVFSNGIGTGILACLGNTHNDHIDFYNNVVRNDNQWYNFTSNTWVAHGAAGGGDPNSPGVIYSSSSGAGTSATYFRIYNNTFYNIARNTIFLASPVYGNNEVKNNLFHTGYFNASYFGVFTSQYNAYWNCLPDAGGGAYGVPHDEVGQQNETSDPVVNAAAGNFQLKPMAKARDHGIDLSIFFTTDILGNPRGSGYGWDIGAYEYAR